MYLHTLHVNYRNPLILRLNDVKVGIIEWMAKFFSGSFLKVGLTKGSLTTELLEMGCGSLVLAVYTFFYQPPAVGHSGRGVRRFCYLLHSLSYFAKLDHSYHLLITSLEPKEPLHLQRAFPRISLFLCRCYY